MINIVGVAVPLFGIVGMTVLLFAWMVEMYFSVKKHKVLIDNRFAAMYIIASGFLIAYAYEINDPIFFWLQVGIVILVLFEILCGCNLSKRKR